MSNFKPSRQKLVEAVKAQALKWYDKSWGWDVVAECLSDQEIDQLIGPKVYTEQGAVKAVYEGFVKPQYWKMLDTEAHLHKGQ